VNEKSMVRSDAGPATSTRRALLVTCLLLHSALAFSAGRAEAPSQNWLSAAQGEMARREYHVSQADRGLQAPNRAQGFRTYFDPMGVRLVDRTNDASLVDLRLREWGRDGAMHAVAPGRVTHQGPRVEIIRPDVVEWYENRAEGLEQGFTLPRKPRGDGDLTLSLSASGVELEASDDAVILRGEAGCLRYAGLIVRDAEGAVIPSAMSVEHGRIVLRVDDRQARYPVIVDPLITGVFDARIEGDQAEAQLGSSVAGAGDVNGDGYADVIIGARYYDISFANQGAAFLYFGGSGAFNTTFDARLQANQAEAQVGSSVAGAGDVNGDGYADVIVGAPGYDNGETNEGAAFVYFGGAGAFDTTRDALLQSNQAEAAFGFSVAGAGDVNRDGYADVIVGATLYDGGQAEEGAAFLYFGSPGAFNTTVDARLEADQADAFMGWSVAGAGDVNGDGYADLIVGAPRYDTGPGEGAAFLYFGRAGAFATTPDAELLSSAPEAVLGSSVAGAGDVNGDGYADVIVGAFGQNNETGAAYVYFGGAGAFNTLQDATLVVNQPFATVGYSVDGAGDVNGDGYADVIVGAPAISIGQTSEGAAFVFFGGEDFSNTTPDAILDSDQAEAFAGGSVAGAGDVNGDGYADVIVGARNYDDGEVNEGTASIYFGRPDAFDVSQDRFILSEQGAATLGYSVSRAGDVNGDGFGDVIVGAPLYDAGETDEGAAFIFFGGNGADFDRFPDAQLESNLPTSLMGGSVAAAGDVNGDGYADVLAGAPGFSNGEAGEGAVFLYLGGAGAFDTVEDARIESNQANAHLGEGAAGVGDVNGDGFADIVVGAPDFDGGHTNEGVAWLYLGGTGAFDTASDARLEVNQTGAAFGRSVAGAGDLNGDGFADVIVGAPLHDQADEGSAFVYFGNPGVDYSQQPMRLTTTQDGSRLGASVSGAGDVNGDGYDDVVVGADAYDINAPDEGAAFVYFGGSPFDGTADERLAGNQGSAFFGRSVAGAGDVNGDGYADVIVGAPFYSRGQSEEGVAFVYLGGATFNDIADARLESDQAGAQFGASVSAAGDVNGDGYADVIVGSPWYTGTSTLEGAAFVYLGGQPGHPVGGARGRPVMAGQYGDDGAAIQPWGRSDAAGGFSVALQATSPRGRERAKLELEACPPRTAFGSLSCSRHVSASWTDLDDQPLDTTLVLSATGLLPRLYHWRARVLYAPLSEAAPLVPMHGPWRRLDASADAADVRVSDVSTTTLVGISPSPSTVGAAVTFTAHVSGPVSSPTDGAITFTTAQGESCTTSIRTPVDADTAAFSCNIIFASGGLRTQVTATFAGSVAYSNSASDGQATHQVLGNDVRLASLALTNHSYAPTFDADTLIYTASVAPDVANIEVETFASDPNALVAIGTYAAQVGGSTRVLVLAPGPNAVDILVTAADGIATRTYRVDVTREQNTGPCSIFCDGFEQ
jgi:hypothetical protein